MTTKHDLPVLVYTNTAVLAYDPFVIRSLFPLHCTTTCLCGCTLTLLFWPMIRIIVGLHNDLIACNACSPSLWFPTRMCQGGHHRHFSVWTVWSSKMVTIALQYDLVVIHYWPYRMRWIAAVLAVCFTNGECYGGVDVSNKHRLVNL